MKMQRNAKHHGAIALALAGILLTAGIAVGAIASAGADDIAISETVFYGDAAAVADATLTQYATMNNQLIWTTTTPLADPSAAKTTLQQSRTQQLASSETVGYFDVIFALNTSSTSSSQFYFTDDSSASWGGATTYPLAMYQDVASRVPANSTYSETVRVADYTDTYTPIVYMRFPDEIGSGYICNAEATAALQAYLSLPVGAHDTANLTMTSDADGGIYEVSATFANGEENKYDYCCGIFYGSTAYFARAVGDDIEIHQFTFAIDSSTKKEMQLVSAALVYTIEDAALTSVMLSLRDGNLFVLSGERFIEEIFVFAIGEENAVAPLALTQTISTDGMAVWDISHYDDFFALTEADGTFAIYQQDGTEGSGTDNTTSNQRAGDARANDAARYQQVLTGNYTTYLTLADDIGYYDVTMAYEDGVLTTALSNATYGYRNDLTTYVTVNSAAGCTFAAAYGTSLAQDATQDSNYTLRGWDSSVVELMTE